MSKKNNWNKLLCSHVDLDGLAAIQLALYFKDKLEFDDILSEDYGFAEDNEKFEYMCKYSNIIIVDLSITENKFKELTAKGINVEIYDHHETSEWLTNYSTNVHDNNRCGTKIFFEDYIKKYISRYPVIIDEFIELVNTYDLWKDTTDLWIEAVNLNSVLYGLKNYREKDFYSIYRDFFNLMTRKFDKLSKWKWTKKEQTIIDKSNAREQQVYEDAMRKMSIRIDDHNKIFGLFSIPSKISLVCSRILYKESNLDYVVAVNTYGGITGKLSFRSKDKINCNDIGIAHGHANACGGVISPDMAIKLLNNPKLVFTYNEDFDENDINTALKTV